MKFKFVFSLLILASVFFASCDDSALNLGENIQPTSDKISIKADTFHLTTETYMVDYIYSTPDSFLLGTYIDNVLGTTRADILTQFYYPTDYKFLDKSVAVATPDSVKLYMTFDSYFGLRTSPMEISVYELQDSLRMKENYRSDINPANFVNFGKRLNAENEGIFTVYDVKDDADNTSVSVKLNNDFLNRFFTSDPAVFASDRNFLNFFKGLYITTDFGSTTLLNVSGVYLMLYYHNTYSKDGSTSKVTLTFPASNLEVKRVNRITHPSRSANFTQNDGINYISSPANCYTRVKIPIEKMRSRLTLPANKHRIINSAILQVNVVDKDTIGTRLPYVKNMLLVKEDELDDFFKNNKLPTSGSSYLVSLDSTSLTSTTYEYHYTFNGLSTLIDAELKNPAESHKDGYVNMVLVPVDVNKTTTSSYYSSSTTINSVRQNTQLQAVGVYSGKNKKIPMKMEVVYSGF
ncbi:MAG TPA: DUF4270 domain-containing protein [Paludibacteraceae bacterium]|nr:DUF4270 domain-containing protein [Paludibacteraceae bacterium]HPT42538.1 DUF4270 domain-containing protein [Paludibacteraceae bacterium]